MRLGIWILVLGLLAAPLEAATVTATWDPNPEPDLAGYRLSYGTAPGVYTTTIDVGNVTSWALALPDGVRSYLAVLAYNTAALTSPYSAEVVSDQTLPPAPLPVPWVTQDVGGPTLPGSTSFAAGVFTVTGAGLDIWDAADQFQFVGQPLIGDGTITARVDSLVNTNALAKAGVMIREDLTAGAPNVLAYLTPARGPIASSRLTRAGATTSSSATVVTGLAPYWVRLTRIGNVFTASGSANGTTWTVLRTVTVPMASAAVAGLAVTSLVPATATTGVFSTVSVTAAPVARPPAPSSSFRVVR